MILSKEGFILIKTTIMNLNAALTLEVHHKSSIHSSNSQKSHYIEILPVVGYDEKNEPRTLATPRPNNCPKENSRRAVMIYF